jgi:hypothetical protein
MFFSTIFFFLYSYLLHKLLLAPVNNHGVRVAHHGDQPGGAEVIKLD